MSLVNGETGEVVTSCTPDAARDLTEQIRVAVEGTWHLVKQAYVMRAWSALGYSSWDAYCTREFGASHLRLPREKRQEVVGSLREAGLSTRAIAAATGIDHSTAVRDLQRSGGASAPPDAEPASAVTGIDGKSYEPRRPPTQGRRDPELSEQEQRERDLREADVRAADRLRQLVNGWHQLRSLPDHPRRERVLSQLIDHDRRIVLEAERIYRRGTDA